MKKTVSVFLLLFVLLFGSTSYAGIISGGTVGSEVWVEQTATAYEWSETYLWTVTESSPITVTCTATETMPGGGCSWEVGTMTEGSGQWTYNFLLYPWHNGFYTETFQEEVNPGLIGVSGGAWDATVNITITWGWPS
jgi:hypothetical protein